MSRRIRQLGDSDFARQDQVFGGLNIFRIQSAGATDGDFADTGFVDVKGQLRERGFVKVRAVHPKTLGEFEQGVMLGILNVCGRLRQVDKEEVRRGPDDMIPDAPLPAIPEMRRLRFWTTVSEIIAASRLSRNGDVYKRVQLAMTRLSRVTMSYKVEAGNRTFTVEDGRLISVVTEDGDDGEFPASGDCRIEVCESLARVFFPSADGVVPGYGSVDIDERRGLKGDCQRLLYVRLCCSVMPAEAANPYGVSFLVDRVAGELYSDPAPRGSGEERRRRMIVRKAFEAIDALPSEGWEAKWGDAHRETVRVRRLRTGREDA